MKKYLFTLLTTLSLALGVTSSASDVLIYKVSLTDTWEQHGASRQSLPNSSNLVGLTPIKGVGARKSYWVMSRGTNQIGEIIYLTRIVDGARVKSFQLRFFTFQDVGITPEDYTLDASGDNDQFMEVASLPTTKPNVNQIVMRSGYQFIDTESFESSTWFFSGTATPALKLSSTITIPNVATTLRGEFYQASEYSFFGPLDLDYYATRSARGPQTATLDRTLTLKNRTTALSGLTIDTLANGVQHVANTLIAQGYDQLVNN
jgi:hypothetical protein